MSGNSIFTSMEPYAKLEIQINYYINYFENMSTHWYTHE